MSAPVHIRIEAHKILWKRGGPNHCFYCCDSISRKIRSLDHLTPLSRGGSNELVNLVLACIECNRAKSDMTLFEFNQFVMKHGGIERVKRLYGKGSHSRRKMLAL